MIVRTPQARAQAAAVGSVEGLCRLLAEAFAGRTPLVADLALGGARPHHLAHDLAVQLGCAVPASAGPPRGSSSSDDPAGIIGQGIDCEARGRVETLTALAAAESICEALDALGPTVLVIILPRFGNALYSEDEWLLRFLIAGSAQTSRPVLLIHDIGAILPDGIEVQALEPPSASEAPAEPWLIPGIWTPDLADLAPPPAGGLDLPNGCRLMPLQTRRPATETPAGHDRLAAAAAHHPWLCAYAQRFGSNYHVRPELLTVEAWRQFGSGAVDGALALMERAADCAPNRFARATAAAQLQGMRIACHRFVDAAKAEPPPPGLPPPLRRFLIQAKGWSAVMSGQSAVGRPLLEHLLAEEPPGLSRLYLMNILALAYARSGEPIRALELETEIASDNRASASPDARLGYVNAINTARLHRAAGRLDLARQSYEEAFATSDGARSETDQIYQPACLARLAEDAGDLAEARRQWLRAAIAFVAARAPEAIGERHAATIMAEPCGEPGRTEAMAAFLSVRLGAPRGDGEAPTFAWAQCGDGGSATWAVGAPGWGLLWTPASRAPAFDGPAHRRLRRHIDRLLRAESEPPPGGSWLLDDAFGCGLPESIGGVYELAVRRRASRVLWDDRTLSLAPPATAAWRRRSRLAVAPLVKRLTRQGPQVRAEFRRQRTVSTVEDPQGLVEAAQAGVSLAQAEPEALARLQAAGVLVVSAAEPVEVAVCA